MASELCSGDLIRVFDIRGHETDWMFDIMRRKALVSKHMVAMDFLNVYKVARLFRKKKLAYCFFHVPQFCLQDSINQKESFLFNGPQLEALIVSQVEMTRSRRTTSWKR